MSEFPRALHAECIKSHYKDNDLSYLWEKLKYLLKKNLFENQTVQLQSLRQKMFKTYKLHRDEKHTYAASNLLTERPAGYDKMNSCRDCGKELIDLNLYECT